MLGVLQLILQRLGQGEYDLKKFDQQLPVLVWRKNFQRQSQLSTATCFSSVEMQCHGQEQIMTILIF